MRRKKTSQGDFAIKACEKQHGLVGEEEIGSARLKIFFSITTSKTGFFF